MPIEEILSEFGLEKNKGKVYLTLLGLGSGTAWQVAKQAKLLRTTTHEILQQLCSLGLISFVDKGRGRTYIAESPQKLKYILKEKERKLNSILPQLGSMMTTDGKRPVVRVYEGIDGIKTVFEDTLTASASVLYGILSMEDLYRIPGKRYMDNYVQRRIHSGIKLNVIRSQSKEVESAWFASTKENREVHFAPNNMIFPTTVYLYDNKMGIIGTKKENFGMIIESADMYLTMKNMFDVLWQVTKVAKKVD